MTTMLAIVAFGASLHASRAEDQLISTFYDITDKSFSLQVIAPPGMVRQLAICKAVWLAEKKKLTRISLSNPSYGQAMRQAQIRISVPQGWIVLDTTAYFTEPNPGGNPMVDVSDKATSCRRMWPWYR